MRLEDVRTILRQAHPELRSCFGVSAISVFGSVARGEDRPDSDVDLIVEFERPISLIRLYSLQDRLEALLGSRVDVGTSASLRPYLRNQILSEVVRVA